LKTILQQKLNESLATELVTAKTKCNPSRN